MVSNPTLSDGFSNSFFRGTDYGTQICWLVRTSKGLRWPPASCKSLYFLIVVVLSRRKHGFKSRRGRQISQQLASASIFPALRRISHPSTARRTKVAEGHTKMMNLKNINKGQMPRLMVLPPLSDVDIVEVLGSVRECGVEKHMRCSENRNRWCLTVL